MPHWKEERGKNGNSRVASPETVSLCLHKINPTALRKAKIVYNFGLSECNRVKQKDKWLGNKKKHYAVDKNL